MSQVREPKLMSAGSLLDFGDSKRVVVSDYILRDEIRLPRVERADSEPREADYFIVED